MGFEREIGLAKRMAREAGTLALAVQKEGVTAEIKPDESPVTAADRACEKLIVSLIEQEFPDDGVLGEEGSSREGRSGRRWIIDPIDGTKDFVRQIPLWSVLIGLEAEGEVVAAAAYNPGQDLLSWAGRGSGAWANGTRLRISKQQEPKHAILCFNGFNKPGVDRFSERLIPWIQRFWAVRSLGGSMDAVFVAQGKADVWIEPNASPWDLAPLKLLVEEAGGRFASFDGENTIYSGNAYACSPGLEPYVHELLRPAS